MFCVCSLLSLLSSNKHAYDNTYYKTNNNMDYTHDYDDQHFHNNDDNNNNNNCNDYNNEQQSNNRSR